MERFIKKFEAGTKYVNIVAAVTKNELTEANGVSDDYLNKKCVKFIPASGAATRMFKDLYEYLNDQEEKESVDRFFADLKQFAFYEDIKENMATKKIDKINDRTEIIRLILEDKLNYGSLPKALLKVHKYDGFATTPIDEHIYEGEQYLNLDNVDLHFTISQEHEMLFKNYLAQVLLHKEQIKISYSFQKPETNTLAVDLNNAPFLLSDGKPLYRVGGHGALIDNLNDLEADIIFVKNIDNVCHRRYAGATIESKRKLASVGLVVKKQIDQHILDILADKYDLAEITKFMEDTLKIVCKEKLTKEMAFSLLNRPLRVCGMVKNQGEPGGGPFIVENEDYYDLQICEKSEINLQDEEKMSILKSSQFFNPVDLVCFVKDYQDKKFNLLEYTNQERYFISEKTYQGKKLKALEHPGLWNGAMHNWNTLFVEVPLETFNPVKTVNDLLRSKHQRS